MCFIFIGCKGILEPSVLNESMILFTSSIESLNNNYNNVFIMDFSGANIINLTETEDAKFIEPRFSNDVSSIAFNAANYNVLDWAMYYMNIRNKNIRLLTKDIVYESIPKFTLSNTKIIFTSLISFLETRISTYNLIRGNITHLTNEEYNSFECSLSDDGNYIVYVSDREMGRSIYLRNLSSFQENILTGGRHPQFSSNSSEIAYMSAKDGNFQIYSMDYNGNNQKNLSNDDSYCESPRYSPDGRKIVFLSERSGERLTHIMDSDGSNQKKLVDIPGHHTHPFFSRSGKHIILNIDGDIYICNSDGSNVQNLTNRTIADWNIAYDSF